ncbi:MAG: ATP-dependent Clp protease proteolytic subunit [Synergistaceae bacterium]|nr:ATP-dependent Clp protease proteolytic subunit [Synergistaceae bacterium]
MTKFWNFLRNDAGERVLRLEGPIDSDNLWGDEITPKAFRAELEADEGDITVWINSPGGSVFSAAEIYTMLCDYKGKVTVKIDAIAASAASVVAMAGERVLMSPVSMLMIHDPMTMAVGNAHDMEKVITTLNEIKESIINAYVKKTGLSRNKVSKLMSDETWLNAKKAVELGFADEILFTDTSSSEPNKPNEPDESNNSSDEEGITLEGGDESSGANAKAVWTASWQPFSTRAMGEAIINRLIPHAVTDEAHTEPADDETVLESGLTATAETAAQETQTQEEETSSELTNSEQATNSVEESVKNDVVPEQTETPEATKPTEEPILETTNSEPAIKNDAVPEQKEPISEQKAAESAAPTKPTAPTAPTEAVKNNPEQQTEEKAPQEKPIDVVRDEPDDLRIGLDGKAKDGSMPYVLLEKQLQLLQ